MEHFSNGLLWSIFLMLKVEEQPLKGKEIEFYMKNSVKRWILACISFKVGLNTKMLIFLLLGNRINYSGDSMSFFQKHEMK